LGTIKNTHPANHNKGEERKKKRRERRSKGERERRI
jgi:hypothetical protein